MNINEILNTAIKEEASDIHLVKGRKPTIRVARELKELGKDELKEADMYEIYDYFVCGNVERDDIYQETKTLDISAVYEGTRLRVNISSADDIPIFTLRLIKNTLPRFNELGVPDVVRRTMHQPQGLILVTGKTNSRKNNNIKCSYK